MGRSRCCGALRRSFSFRPSGCTPTTSVLTTVGGSTACWRWPRSVARAAGSVRATPGDRRAMEIVRCRAGASDRHAAHGVPLLLLLPGPGPGSHPRFGRLESSAAPGVEQRSVAVAAGHVDDGDLPGARSAWDRAMVRRGATYFTRERGELVQEAEYEPEDVFADEGYEGVATAVMAAVVERRKATFILNVPNRGAIGGLRDEDVVEVTCLADEHGAHPVAQGQTPEAALALVGQVKLYERLAVSAAMERSYETALDALLAHRLVASYPVAKAPAWDRAVGTCASPRPGRGCGPRRRSRARSPSGAQDRCPRSTGRLRSGSCR